jgi:transposase
MFSITSARYYLYREVTDIRKGFDSLSGLVSGQLGQNPMSGDVFIFVNRQRNRIKLLRWEPGGFVLFYKRLEKGTFELPVSQKTDKKLILDYGELAMLITGISMRNAKKGSVFYNIILLIKRSKSLVYLSLDDVYLIHGKRRNHHNFQVRVRLDETKNRDALSSTCRTKASHFRGQKRTVYSFDRTCNRQSF